MSYYHDNFRHCPYKALSNFLWVVVLDCDFFVQDIAFVPSYSHVS